jgi:steroid 5-alpha reductase family enzyme
MKLRDNRTLGFAVIFLIYLAATAAGIGVFWGLGGYPLLTGLAAADITATLVVWAAGLIFHNASVYDPYWSVAPVVMVPLTIAFEGGFSPVLILVTAVIVFWGVRLTANWAVTFHNLNTEDWRYTRFRERNGRLWFFINLFGIHLFPTAVVFGVMTPVFLLIRPQLSLNSGTVFSALLCAAAVTLQIVADRQMHRFKRSTQNAGRVIRTGAWKYSRHPNYLGEILMWWGVYLLQLSVFPTLCWTFLGPLVNTVMFVTVSIPMMEARQLKNKPEYAEYRKKTGMLLPKLFSR